MDFDKVIKNRHSVRRFKTMKHANWRDIIKAIDAANSAPLAGNIFTNKFILVIDKEKINQLAEAAQQAFIADADYVVVVCSDNKRLVTSYYERGKKYAIQQAAAAIENFLLKITDLGLASCWVGAFSDNSVRKILGIPDEIEVEAILPIGYEMGKANPPEKPNLDRILFFERWKKKYMEPLKKPEAL